MLSHAAYDQGHPGIDAVRGRLGLRGKLRAGPVGFATAAAAARLSALPDRIARTANEIPVAPGSHWRARCVLLVLSAPLDAGQQSERDDPDRMLRPMACLAYFTKHTRRPGSGGREEEQTMRTMISICVLGLIAVLAGCSHSKSTFNSAVDLNAAPALARVLVFARMKNTGFNEKVYQGFERGCAPVSQTAASRARRCT